MASRELDSVMNAFYDRQYDVLLSTSIVESGLDIPTANTLIVHRADMFGLAQLYQLRGRVGRSKVRAYAYITIPADARLTPAAEKRLKVLQSLDTLGAGFMLASHDLDIRGAGNLLGEEQSGHIREVGFELYQSMLEEAVVALKGGEGAVIEDQWSPRINLGTSVLIPEDYVPDLQVRLGLYRRLSSADSHDAIEAFAAELIDRFGPLPVEVKHLLDIVEIKALCRQAGVEQIDAGPKGAVLAFRNKSFANPEGLIAFIREEGTGVKLQPDHRLIYYADWETPEERLAGARVLLRRLVRDRRRGEEGGVSRLRRTPPGVDLIAVERRVGRALEPVPIGEPLRRQMEQGHDVVTREQKTVERAHGRNEALAVLGLEQCLDHGVDAGALHASIVVGALGRGGIAPPAEELLVPRRQRHRPIVLEHVVVIGQLAPLILRRVDLADARIDADLLQGAGVGEQQAFLGSRGGENLEADRRALLVAELALLQAVARLLEQS